jgi:hypothetical protein
MTSSALLGLWLVLGCSSTSSMSSTSTIGRCRLSLPHGCSLCRLCLIFGDGDLAPSPTR